MRFLKKYQRAYRISALVVFLAGAIMWFYDFASGKDGMKLFGGILFTIMALFQIGELSLYYKNRKSEQVKSDR